LKIITAFFSQHKLNESQTQCQLSVTMLQILTSVSEGKDYT